MENKKIIAGITEDGIEVYRIVNDEHMEAHKDVEDMNALIKEAIRRIHSSELSSGFFMESICLGRIIGKDNCIEVTNKDEIRKLRRKNRAGDTPIVFNKEAADSEIFTVGICRDEDDNLYTVFTGFVGKKAPREPWDENIRTEREKEESLNFWEHHALVYVPGMLENE